MVSNATDLLPNLRTHLAAWRVRLRSVDEAYRRAHGRAPHLFRPRRYTEKLQWRKLFDLDPRYAILTDKRAVRDFIAARIGSDYLIPLLWEGVDPDAIPFDALVPPYVVKSTHASGHTIFVTHDRPADRDAVRAAARWWLGNCHGTTMDEPAYIHVPRRLVIERLLLSASSARPIEYKFFVFHGQVAIVRHIVLEAGDPSSGSFYTPAWARLAWSAGPVPLEPPVPRPPLLDEMIRVALRVSAGFDHLRVDMYDCGDRFWLGEITLYPWSGLDALSPDQADYQLGAYWKLRYPAARALTTMMTRSWDIRPPDAE